VGTVVHQVGEAWGQIRGGAYTYKDGKKVLTADGMYVVTPNSYLGSVLPDFTGGWFNQIQYKDFVLSANIEFSKVVNTSHCLITGVVSQVCLKEQQV
jgi:hypothetical protein